ncbi:haloacid dehalogenase-like hydrolase domain-containing 5 isoform X1 [Hemicordylus capensis]|uniref:haloacid dehalogenase-like hydrolase domain-containing 5 isoform X1 n=1 Tax=Hemicordylus capensis TaxID=884348 RepID=UPI0023025354|nr:haloacid dehalogenase-like hydrolase domain-containing 5 isoform X1 [Hemicordylus capensis]
MQGVLLPLLCRSLQRAVATGLSGLCSSADPSAAAAAAAASGESGPGAKLNVQPTFGFLFDIDGVLVRGKTPIPAARKAFQKLLNSQGQFLVPVVFVTNAGNCLRQKKADQLSHVLGVPISQDQVMMSHSPLRMFKRFHDKCVLVSGQGPLLEIAEQLGFCQPITIDKLRETYPLLDMVDHDRRPKVLHPPAVQLPKIEAVVLFGEPVRWETNLQLIIDVLLTSGYPGNPYPQATHPHIPVLACNMDLMWVAEAQSPRFGHGTFMVCLENIYKKITGKDLKYEALMGKPSELTYHYAEYLIRVQAAAKQWSKPIQTLYAIGDNLMTDIYGANLYNRYLEEKNPRRGSKARIQAKAAGGTRSATISQEEELDNTWESELASATATSCRSVLVCTGVYNPHTEVPFDTRESITETVFHGHRDFRFDPALVEPDHIVPDVDAAVDLIFQLENFASNENHWTS